jgi:hypothetical protein
VRRERNNNTAPITIRISPSPPHRHKLPRATSLLSDSAVPRGCTVGEVASRGSSVPSGSGLGAGARDSAGKIVAVAVSPSAVGDGTIALADAAAEGCARVDVGDREAVGKLVAVTEAVAGLLVGVGDGTVPVGDGVLEGTSVGTDVGGGDVGLAAVGVLVAPVGVIVGMVWFRSPA